MFEFRIIENEDDSKNLYFKKSLNDKIEDTADCLLSCAYKLKAITVKNEAQREQIEDIADSLELRYYRLKKLFS